MIFLVRWWHFSVTLFMAAKPSTPPKEPEIEGTKFIERNVLQHTEAYSYWRCTQFFRIGKKNYQQFSRSCVQRPWQNGSLHWWADMLSALLQSYGPGSTQQLHPGSILNVVCILFFPTLGFLLSPTIQLGINYKTRWNPLFPSLIELPENFNLLAMAKCGMSYQRIRKYACSSVPNFLLLGKQQ